MFGLQKHLKKKELVSSYTIQFSEIMFLITYSNSNIGKKIFEEALEEKKQLAAHTPVKDEDPRVHPQHPHPHPHAHPHPHPHQ